MDMVDVLETRLEQTGRLVAGVRGDQLGAPTPCSKWDVRALLNHIIGGHHLMVGAAEGKRIDPDAGMADFCGEDAGAEYERSSKLLVETFREPGVLERHFALGTEIPGEQALGIAIMEAVVHGWDLARATDQDARIDPQLATMMLQAIQGAGLVDQFRSPEGHPFGPELQTASDASPSDKLVAYLGRRP